jgi:hypothetical protein
MFRKTLNVRLSVILKVCVCVCMYMCMCVCLPVCLSVQGTLNEGEGSVPLTFLHKLVFITCF